MDLKTIEWNKKYEIGIEDIDLQHHYFVNLISRFAREASRSTNKKYVTSLMQELIAYTKFHFKSEETLMVYYEYPEHDNHRKLHYELIENLNMELGLIQNHSHIHDIERFVDFLSEWFFKHTRVEDIKFSNFISSNAKA